MKKTTNGKFVIPDTGYPLISRERTEKLDLLNHLITNLAHTIIVCGPVGIGKTFLLRNLKESIQEPIIFSLVQGDNQLSLEKIQDLIAEAVFQKLPSLKATPLAGLLERLAHRDAKIVFAIDDAGLLAPGLIEKIIDYANKNPILRVIFALTHSELYLKNGTDPSVDDCYQIEIPPLSEEQCTDYLEYLSTLPKPRIGFAAINESMVGELYRETHGIPGNILIKLPQPIDTTKPDYSKAILTYAVAGLIVIALGVQWWSSRPRPQAANKEEASQPVWGNSLSDEHVTHPANPSVNVPSRIRNDIIADSYNHASIEQDLKVQDNTILLEPKTEPAETIPAGDSVTNKVQPASVASPQATLPGKAAQALPMPNLAALDEGGKWLMQQPVENVTLQLMALSNEQAILEVLQKHRALGQNLRYLKTTTKRGKERFVLLYGSFPNPEQALAEKNNLPKDLQNNWLRKIGAVQAEIAIAAPIDTPG